jgi:glutamyl-Q tRNA(Asp) synthetase
MPVTDNPLVVGRFAPSPTGALHIGSLYTALASFLAARSQQGRWLLRIDDLDTPRTVKGSVDAIIKTLDCFGLHWDGAVAFQSQQLALYQDALERLMAGGWVYPCSCSRKTLTTEVYPGYCLNKIILPEQEHALRVRTDARTIVFDDSLQGPMAENLAALHGDFILKRKDQLFAYQFAVVLDDAIQGVNQVVRGVDLLDSTPKQIYLHQLMNLPLPHYSHLPIIVDQDGYKLSKQTKATAVDPAKPEILLYDLLVLLGQNPPPTMRGANVAELLAWAVLHWNPCPLHGIRQIGWSGG